MCVFTEMKQASPDFLEFVFKRFNLFYGDFSGCCSSNDTTKYGKEI